MGPKSEENERSGNKCLSWLKRNAILIALVISMCAGVGLGLGLRELDPPMDKKSIVYLGFPGDLLLRMLKMLILPLIISSMITGVAALGKTSGRMGGIAVLYYMATTLLAVILGIILVVAIQPGNLQDVDNIEKKGEAQIVSVADSILDLIRMMFPDNLVTACFQQQKTKQEYVLVNDTKNDSIAPSQAVNITGFSVEKSDGTNILGLLVFSIAFGLVLANMGHTAKPLVDFFDCVNNATMKLITVVIWYSPIGVMFLIAAKLVEMDDIASLFKMLGLYAATVLAGLGIHGLIILPLLYLVLVRKNPFKYIYGVLEALVTALGTASSSATLPVTFRCLEENNHIDQRVTRFVLPIGATINMDGTALYEAVAAIFIAQLNDLDLGVGQIITISITATLASIGAAGVPQAGLVTMSIVLTAVGLPQTDVVYIIAIDWLLDRFRTMVNVLGDSIGAGIVYRFNKKQLDEIDEEEAVASVSNVSPPHYVDVTNTKTTDFSNGETNNGFVPDGEANTAL